MPIQDTRKNQELKYSTGNDLKLNILFRKNTSFEGRLSISFVS